MPRRFQGEIGPMSRTFAGGNNYNTGHTPNEQNTRSLSKRDNNLDLSGAGTVEIPLTPEKHSVNSTATVSRLELSV